MASKSRGLVLIVLAIYGQQGIKNIVTLIPAKVYPKVYLFCQI